MEYYIFSNEFSTGHIFDKRKRSLAWTRIIFMVPILQYIMQRTYMSSFFLLSDSFSIYAGFYLHIHH